MSEKLRESLSAIVDDEAGEFELRRVLDEVDKDPALKATWERYHLFGAVMRSEQGTGASNLRDRVWAALEFDAEEDDQLAAVNPLQAVEGRGARTPWLGRFTALAVAATVAFAVVVGGVGGFDREETPVVADNTVVVPVPAATVTLQHQVTDRDQARINAYMLYHTQQRGMNQPGMGAFAKMASYRPR